MIDASSKQNLLSFSSNDLIAIVTEGILIISSVGISLSDNTIFSGSFNSQFPLSTILKNFFHT